MAGWRGQAPPPGCVDGEELGDREEVVGKDGVAHGRGSGDDELTVTEGGSTKLLGELALGGVVVDEDEHHEGFLVAEEGLVAVRWLSAINEAELLFDAKDVGHLPLDCVELLGVTESRVEIVEVLLDPGLSCDNAVPLFELGPDESMTVSPLSRLVGSPENSHEVCACSPQGDLLVAKIDVARAAAGSSVVAADDLLLHLALAAGNSGELCVDASLEQGNLLNESAACLDGVNRLNQAVREETLISLVGARGEEAGGPFAEGEEGGPPVVEGDGVLANLEAEGLVELLVASRPQFAELSEKGSEGSSVEGLLKGGAYGSGVVAWLAHRNHRRFGSS